MFVACDESGADKKDRFFVLGSSWIPKEHVSKFEEKISGLRLRFKCWGEVKWGKVNDCTPDDIMHFYKEFVQAVSHIDMYFRFISADKRKLDENSVSEELHLKFMYLLISRNAVRGDLRKKVNPSELHILFDQFQESRKSQDEKWRKRTRDFINRYLKCEIEHFQPCDSHINSLIQLTDVVTGLVCKIKNSGKSSMSKNEIQLADFIFEKYGNKFDIWSWHPYPRE